MVTSLHDLIQKVEAEGSICPVCGETSPGAQWVCLYRLDAAAKEAVRAAGRCDYSIEGSERIGARLREVGAKIAETRSHHAREQGQ